MIYKVRIPKEKELTLVVSRLLRKGYSQNIIVTNKPDGLRIDTKNKIFEYIDAESVIDFEELNGTPILPSELDREVFKVRKIAMDKQDLLICNHCKKIWTGLINRCNCGCTTLTKTHESNRKYACNSKSIKVRTNTGIDALLAATLLCKVFGNQPPIESISIHIRNGERRLAGVYWDDLTGEVLAVFKTSNFDNMRMEEYTVEELMEQHFYN